MAGGAHGKSWLKDLVDGQERRGWRPPVRWSA